MYGIHIFSDTFYAFTHRSAFSCQFSFLLLHAAPVAIVQALTGGGHSLKVVIAVQTTVATGPTVMNRLVGEERVNKGRDEDFS